MPQIVKQKTKLQGTIENRTMNHQCKCFENSPCFPAQTLMDTAVLTHDKLCQRVLQLLSDGLTNVLSLDLTMQLLAVPADSSTTAN